MSTKALPAGDGLIFKFAVTGIFLISPLVAPQLGYAQATPDHKTVSIERGSAAERALNMKEPSYETREERLKAKPLDWKSTIGKPKRRVLTPAERKALSKARRGATSGGAPDPKADEVARKLHPEDWKQSDR